MIIKDRVSYEWYIIQNISSCIHKCLRYWYVILYFKLRKDPRIMGLPFQDLVGVIIPCVVVQSHSLDWVSGSLQVWSGYTEYTGNSKKRVGERMRRRAWWKRFILGSDLITCIQSSLQCPQSGSADAVCLFFSLSSFIISFQSVPPAFCDGAEIKYGASPSL